MKKTLIIFTITLVALSMIGLFAVAQSTYLLPPEILPITDEPSRPCLEEYEEAKRMHIFSNSRTLMLYSNQDAIITVEIPEDYGPYKFQPYELKWQSSDPSIATVRVHPNLKDSAIVSAKLPGRAWICVFVVTPNAVYFDRAYVDVRPAAMAPGAVLLAEPL